VSHKQLEHILLKLNKASQSAITRQVTAKALITGSRIKLFSQIVHS